MGPTATREHLLETLDEVVIRFAGDSGDGMQITGTQFTNTTAVVGNDLATFPDYPAEIRAPAGSLPGVSGFQLHFSSHDIHTPGDQPDVLVAMNPAALKVNLGDLRPGGMLIVNTGNFGAKDLEKARYEHNPLDDAQLYEKYNVVKFDLNEATIQATEGLGLGNKEALRCKNMLALGMLYWVYSRPMETSERWLAEKFGKKPELLEANLRALRAGHRIAENSELFHHRYQVPPAQLAPGTYRNIMGNAATAMGLVTASRLSGLPLFYGSYPITPASDILHSLARYKNYGVITFQAEDEIAAVTSALGAAFAGALGATASSGPGIALKTEAMGLAVSVELPLVIVDVQRGGPSTGLPTKTEQADLLQAVFGRNSEAPIPVLAACSPGDCFWTAIEAARIAVTYMTPVIMLSDGYLANGAEPWRVPEENSLQPFPVRFKTNGQGGGQFLPYLRDPVTLARGWAVPGTPGLQHRIGGLEKQDVTGNVNYEPGNHEMMVKLREQKVLGIAASYPPLEVFGPPRGKLLVLGWGSTYGAIRSAVERAHAKDLDVAQLHIRHLWPLPRDLGQILQRYDTILIPELNRGQFSRLIRAEYLIPTVSYPKVQGRPFTASELLRRIEELAR
ncbi:MAG: 2-oxoacid:acceptor oxidoreductase subunit alpha [Planctomycetota bacterium]|nr:MAG: 2-oxoacid:acceptor oxidoreductase subunit alpha [Planctomycetota bacterium]